MNNTMIKNLSALLIGVLMAGWMPAVHAQSSPEMTVDELKAHVGFLASDSLKGRKTGTPEGEVAARYIRDQFKSYGLKMMAANGFQSFEVVNDVRAGQGNRFTVGDFQGTLYEDFIPMSFSGNSTLGAGVVFVGYGFDIATDTITWNDYDQVDVGGKWVLIFRGDPEPDKMDSFYIPYTMERSKVVNATDHGAAGVIFVTPAGVEEKDKLPKMFYDKTASSAGIPVVSVTRKVADKILAASGQTIGTLETQLTTTMKPQSFATGKKVKATTNVVTEKAITQNVVAMIEAPGSDEYIVLGAHYDHLGMGGPGSGSRMPDTVAYHNGADDNASGVAGIIELAGKLAANQSALDKNIIFIAFAAEEMGLLGSKYFTEHALVPKDQIMAMMNFDMIGRMEDDDRALSVGGTGTAEEFEALLNKHLNEDTFTLKTSKDGYGPSDHAAFYAENVPVLFFSTGAHDDYHTPFDDADKINYPAQQEVLRYAYDVIEEVISQKALAFKKTGSKDRGHQRTRLKVTFGIIPDYAGKTGKGMSVDGVRDGGPAATGGMKKGDIIVAIEGKPVGDIYEYMHRLQALEAGQRVSVDVMRNGEKKVLILQL